ncbi:hypothetical protein SmJEL517_g03523 [Synchytrium microbalum]|uniref:Cytochrome b5 heme-binding domain-containing protein n=1 Tax=Synchytrium microbalum TaxID=1806994 RepID=A0A507C3G8_9FUNG|nr:uncharacterized protein SmJEL517_g03523 [Synchytrium microbalum]TPX33599.1 hypothetical protein SmJEL517_g03523 [Synchytrium microbalum]
MSKVWTLDAVKKAKEAGELIIIYQGKVYNITKWLPYHPGGMDATDAITAFHPKWVLEEKLPKFCVGGLAEYHPSKASRDFLALEARLQKEGYFETNYWFYVREFIKTCILTSLAVWLLVKGRPGWFEVVASCLTLAAMWHQVAFVAHDAGHNGITHNRYIDGAIGTLVANFVGGLSIGWWKSSHNVHHIVTNDPEHDPDIQLLPFFAVTTRLFTGVYSTYYKAFLEFDLPAKLLIRFQHLYYYIILGFGRFNLHALSISHLSKNNQVNPYRMHEIALTSIFWCWYLYLLSYVPTWPMVVVYVLLGHIATFLLHVQITLSHYGMSCEEHAEDEEFAVKALRTTMNVDCPWYIDWLHGGLQFQVEHHLFPRMPRHNLRKVRPFVRQYAKDNGITYVEYPFAEGNWVVLANLKHVALQAPSLASILGKE